jgi:hypothetical protein
VRVNLPPSKIRDRVRVNLPPSKIRDRVRVSLLLVGMLTPLLFINSLKQVTLAIEDHHRSYEDLGLESEVRFRMIIRNLYGLFVTIIDYKVYLTPWIARYFLIAKSQTLDGCWRQYLDPMESELLIAKVCVTYLMFTAFENGLIDDTRISMDETWQHYDGERSLRIENHGILNYAASFWATHLKRRKTEQQTHFCDDFSQSLTWDPGGFKCPSRFTGRGLSWAAANGHEGVVKLLQFSRHCTRLWRCWGMLD